MSSLKATECTLRCTAEWQPIDIPTDSIGMKRGRRGKSREEVSVNWHDGASLHITRDGLSLRLTSNCTSLLTRLWTSHDISEMEKLTGGSLSVPPFHFSTLALRATSHYHPRPCYPPLLSCHVCNSEGFGGWHSDGVKPDGSHKAGDVVQSNEGCAHAHTCTHTHSYKYTHMQTHSHKRTDTHTLNQSLTLSLLNEQPWIIHHTLAHVHGSYTAPVSNRRLWDFVLFYYHFSRHFPWF